MDLSGTKAKPVRRSNTNTGTGTGTSLHTAPTVHMGPETPRDQQGRSIARGITRGNSSKSGFSAGRSEHNNSRVYPDDNSRISKIRRNSFDQLSELCLSSSNEAQGNNCCCNMKFSDLANENYRDNVYNPFEASIITDRKDNRSKHVGRSIASIRKNPNISTLSFAGILNMTKSTSQMRTMVSYLLPTQLSILLQLMFFPHSCRP